MSEFKCGYVYEGMFALGEHWRFLVSPKLRHEFMREEVTKERNEKWDFENQ